VKRICLSAHYRQRHAGRRECHLLPPAHLFQHAGRGVWLAGSLVVAPLREAMSATDLLLIIALVAVDWTIFWFARHSRKRGWLR